MTAAARRLPGKACRDLHRALTARGWQLVEVRRNHPVYQWPPTGDRMTVPGSPSDWRTGRNTLATARRIEQGRAR